MHFSRNPFFRYLLLSKSTRNFEMRIRMRKNLHSASLRALIRAAISNPGETNNAKVREYFSDQSSITVERVTWDGSSCEMVENIARGEMVNPISNVKRIKSRFCPNSRRVFALVHKEAPGFALGCLHVALTTSIPRSLNEIGEVDEENMMYGDQSSGESDRSKLEPQTFERDFNPDEAKCAIFYTISNLQPNLVNWPVGRTLIMGASDYFKATMPHITTFCTLSPVPTFAPWLQKELEKHHDESSIPEVITDESVLEDLRFVFDPSLAFSRKKVLMQAYGKEFNALALHYLTRVKNEKYPLCARDSVAHFHLKNGSTLKNLYCPYAFGQLTEPVTQRTWVNNLGYTANYFYDLDKLATNAVGYSTKGNIDVDDCLDSTK